MSSDNLFARRRMREYTISLIAPLCAISMLVLHVAVQISFGIRVDEVKEKILLFLGVQKVQLCLKPKIFQYGDEKNFFPL